MVRKHAKPWTDTWTGTKHKGGKHKRPKLSEEEREIVEGPIRGDAEPQVKR